MQRKYISGREAAEIADALKLHHIADTTRSCIDSPKFNDLPELSASSFHFFATVLLTVSAFFVGRARIAGHQVMVIKSFLFLLEHHDNKTNMSKRLMHSFFFAPNVP